jgi:hypothetical protein
MKITSRLSSILILGSILFFSMSCHSQSPTLVTITVSNTPTPPSSPTQEPSSQIPVLTDIQINPKPGNYLVDRNGNTVSVFLKSVSPIYVDDFPEGRSYLFNYKLITSKKGDLYLVLPFQIESHISKVQYLDITANGYDADGNLVSVCLNSGPIFGQKVVEMQPNGLNNVGIMLLPSKDIVRVELVVIGIFDIVPA